MSDVTRLLDVAAAGNRRAATAELFPLVHDELRRLTAVTSAARSRHLPTPRTHVWEQFGEFGMLANEPATLTGYPSGNEGRR
jgi:hypothetical protein